MVQKKKKSQYVPCTVIMLYVSRMSQSVDCTEHLGTNFQTWIQTRNT
jgi:hypothetical protein